MQFFRLYKGKTAIQLKTAKKLLPIKNPPQKAGFLILSQSHRSQLR